LNSELNSELNTNLNSELNINLKTKQMDKLVHRKTGLINQLVTVDKSSYILFLHDFEKQMMEDKDNQFIVQVFEKKLLDKIQLFCKKVIKLNSNNVDPEFINIPDLSEIFQNIPIGRITVCKSKRDVN